MSEYKLTTGQVLDKIKIDDIYENQDGYKLKVGRKGDILMYQLESDLNIEGDCKFSTTYEWLQKDRWKKLINFVSFEDAIQSLIDGYTIQSHLDGHVYGVFNDIYDLYKIEDVEIREAKWEVIKSE